ncbi:hypothetical protein LTR70_000157 [Exophiala xenobiotica]|uniref:Rhodopsin domain-containing protein n=1 Tax=Lithohypha guttulata TaxID=1690604 RepID=A0ABR0KP97_9EURO|nr:hypothetical protein LTR24_000282 [Lithohypha guttulata]KAK5330835.1 hypothetical protein LTR70_000157 [Exophiala xenobiotica]
MSDPNPGFELESWCLYGVGAACVVLRLVSRIRRAGVRQLQLDDGFVFFGLLSYTLLCVAFNEMLKGGGSNLMPDEEVAQLTPAITAQRVNGSKWVFVSEHAMLLTIWSMKAAMLVLYARVTQGLMQRKILNGVIAWVVLSFVGDELALFTICRPLSQYWAVPVSNQQCASYQYYQIVNAVFNISTDVLLLAIGLPPVLKARLSIQQKLILAVVFGMGSFVIVAAILRAIYCVVPSLVSYVYMNWYFREASVAIYVTNAPAIWVLLREIFPGLQRLGYTTRKTTSGNKLPNHGGAYVTSQVPGVNPDKKANWMRIGGRGYDEKALNTIDMDEYPINKAEVTASFFRANEGHRRQNSQDDASVSSQGGGQLEIRRDVTFSVSHIDVKQNV